MKFVSTLEIPADWRGRMACTGADPALFDLDATPQQLAESEEVCLGCPVFFECRTVRRAENDVRPIRGVFAGEIFTGSRTGRVVPMERFLARHLPAQKAGEVRTCANSGCDTRFTVTAPYRKRRFCSRSCCDRNRYVSNGQPVETRTCQARGCSETFIARVSTIKATCSRTCYQRLRHHNRQAALYPLVNRPCALEGCDVQFVQVDRRQKYCCPNHRWNARYRKKHPIDGVSYGWAPEAAS